MYLNPERTRTLLSWATSTFGASLWVNYDPVRCLADLGAVVSALMLLSIMVMMMMIDDDDDD